MAPPAMRQALGCAAVLLTAGGISTSVRLARSLQRSRLLDRMVTPNIYQPIASAALTATSLAAGRSPAAPQSLLIVGDSTALGTGASSPAASLAGRFARSYPHLQVANRGRRGARFAGTGDEISRCGRHDVIMILAGANDIIRHTPQAQLEADIDHAILQASQRASHVIVVPAPNIGNAPIFPAPLSWWLTMRAWRLHAVCRASVAARGATYVNLFRRWRDDPFAHHPDLIASDGMHPSDAGYAYWFDELERQAPLTRFLAPGARPDRVARQAQARRQDPDRRACRRAVLPAAGLPAPPARPASTG